MLSQNLSELIHLGKAKYNTFVIGATGSSRIPVPQDCYIVVIDVIFSHFIDRSGLDPSFDIQHALKNNIHHLRFKSQSETYNYTIRSPFTMQFFEGIDFITPVEPDIRFDTYQVHTTDVHVDLWRLQPFTDWIVSAGKLPNSTAEPAGPLGYGTVNSAPNQNVVRKIDLDGTGASNYIPYGSKSDQPLTDGFREQFFSQINNKTSLNIPATNDPDCNLTFPIINVGYVLVKQPWERKHK